MSDRLWMEFPPTSAHLEAIGQVVVQWAYFEVRFDELIGVLRLNGKARELAAAPPSQFNKRAALLRESATVCFQSCEPLRQRFVKIADTAMQLRRKRDHIAHGTWFAQARRKEPDQIGATLTRRGTHNRVMFKVETIQKIAIDISYQSRHLMALTRLWPIDFLIDIPPDERRTLENFLRENLPPLPTPQIPRDS